MNTTQESAQALAAKRRRRRRKKRKQFLHSLSLLLIKFLIMALLVFILFGYVFGLMRNLSLNMQPAFEDGDLVLYFRVVDDYAADDVVVVSYQGREMLERVIAVGGDTVDITVDGLRINDALVQENAVLGETTQFEDGVTFPLTVPKGQLFVLGDNREHATDSRVFGCIRTEDVNGRVMGLFRRRNF